MSDNDTNDRDNKRPDATGGDFSERLRKLDQALKKAQADHADGDEHSPRPSSSTQGMAQALKLASEFAAGIIVGAVLGWFIDWSFGISPWGLMVFLMLGFAAGIMNILRSSGLIKPGRGGD